MGTRGRGIKTDALLKTPAVVLLKLMAILLIILLVAGCGYHFTPGGEYIDKGIRTVYVDSFTNRTSEPGVENDFRSAFIDEFVRGGRFKLVDQQALADAVFKGSIDGLTTSHLSYRSDNLAAEERMEVVLNVSFEERQGNKIIWANKSFPGRQDYTVDTRDLSITQTSRKSGLGKLAKDTAERAYRMMMSGF